MRDERLPERIFATDRFPSRRVNMYASIDYLLVVKEVLKDTAEMARVLGSGFGGLFKLPVRRLTMSGKLVHGLLTRQVVSRKKYELMNVFWGKPLRFSLVEFGAVTGLNCGEFEEGYDHEYQIPAGDGNFAYWERLIGKNQNITIAEIAKMVATDSEMEAWRRLRLCLLMIIDGVLVATTQNPKPTLKYVRLVEDLDKFFSFPTMKPAPKVLGKCEDPIGDYRKKMRHETVKMVGFPIALQLFALQVIPQLVNRLGGDDNATLLDYRGGSIPKHSGLTLAAVLEAEHDESLIAQPMLDRLETEDEGWAMWDDERMDKKVEYMYSQVGAGHVFTKDSWGGGDSGEPLYDHTKKPAKLKRQRTGVAVEVGGPSLKQRRISGYFTRNTVVEDERYVALEVRVEELSKEVTVLKKNWERHRQEIRMRAARSPRKGKGSKKQRTRAKKVEMAGVKKGAKIHHERSGKVGNSLASDRSVEHGGDVLELADHEVCPGMPLAEPEGEDELAGDGVEVREDVFPINYVDQADVEDSFGGLPSQVPDGTIVKQAGAVPVEAEEVGSGEELTDGECAGQEKKERVLDVSDSSPTSRTTRHKPHEREAELAALLLMKDLYHVPEFVPLAVDGDYPFFEEVLQSNLNAKHLTVEGYEFDNKFFMDLAEAECWVTSTHMDVLMRYIRKRRGTSLRDRRSTFIAPWFTAHLDGKVRAFKAAKAKGRVVGDSKIMKYLTMEGQRWGVDVDTLYAPMIWGGSHWVGLCISLDDWRVLVLDPNPSLRSIKEVKELMQPIACMLPYLAQKICPANAVGEHLMVPFHVERLDGVYENIRSGDCGPVAAKFIEMHATGDEHPTMAGLTDELVDIFRKDYAMNIYKDWVVPVYVG
ncbi:hypothetical protein N665_0049s0029 [Sinapis alba]|nr:hypothetical protein N665_0049s0029 [Sinapis alba]